MEVSLLPEVGRLQFLFATGKGCCDVFKNKQNHFHLPSLVDILGGVHTAWQRGAGARLGLGSTV